MRAVLPFFLAALILPAPARAAENVPLPPFRSVELRGGGDITIVPGPVQRVTLLQGSSQITRLRMREQGQLQIDVCHGQCPRNYQLQIRIESPHVPDVAIAAGGNIRAAGGFARQSQLSAAIDGGGKIDVRAVEVGDVSAAVNGGGLISVRPRSTLSAAVNGGGSIRYSGNPRVSSTIHGGGSVNRGD
jgi:putative autotransporter adhesin-like protein